MSESMDASSNLKSTEYSISLRDGAELFYRAWLPLEPSSKALILFHRGHEHSGRWQEANGIRYIQYIVSDLDAVDAHAREKGANIHTPIFDLGAMARIMFIADPDGVINEFVGRPER